MACKPVTFTNKKALSALLKGLCAQDWIRTSTSLRTLRPEHSASTNFATWASGLQRYEKLTKKPLFQGEFHLYGYTQVNFFKIQCRQCLLGFGHGREPPNPDAVQCGGIPILAVIGNV